MFDTMSFPYLWLKAIAAGHNGVNLNNTTDDMIRAVLTDLADGSLTIELTIPDRPDNPNTTTTTHSVDIANGIDVIEVPFSDTDADPSFYQHASRVFRWKIAVINNKVIYYVAFTIPSPIMAAKYVH